MSIFWSVVWCLGTIAVMYGTNQYYIPRLRLRTNSLDQDEDSIEDGEQLLLNLESTNVEKPLFGRMQNLLITAAICGCLAGWWGFVASEHCTSDIAMVKLTVAMLVFACVFLTDLELMIIPNACSLVLLGSRFVTIGLEAVLEREELVSWLINSIVGFVLGLLLLLVIVKITKGGLGFGDVKIFSSLGFLCGLQAVFYTLTFSFFLCAIVSTILLLTKKKGMKDALPMGPFIWAGYGITVVLSII